jgi:uncharacterized protein
MPNGRLWRMDDEGYILNDAHAAYIRSPFDRTVQDAIAAYTESIVHDVHSIYICGSVARGLAVEGKSDLNVFAVLNEFSDPDLVLRDWRTAAEETILDKHPSITDIRLDLWPYTYVSGDPAYFSIGAFIIKTQSVCVWGSDVTSELPEYRVSPHIANDDIVQIKDDVQDALDDIQANPRRVRGVCHRVSKNLLHTGFSLVMLDEGIYTRDLDVSHEYFAKHYPDYSDAMRQALEYAHNPPRDPQPVVNMLNQLGGFLIAEADKWLDRYNPERHIALPTDEFEEQ